MTLTSTRKAVRLGQALASTGGFTLLEALIATLMMALIISALGSVSAQWLPNWNRGIARVQRDQALGVALERIVDDLSAVLFVPPSRELRAPLFDGTDTSILFVRPALGPNATTGLDIVRIETLRTQQRTAVVRTRAPAIPLGPNAWRDLRFSDPVVLLGSRLELYFAYRGRDSVWRDAWRSQISLPTSVKLTVIDAASANRRMLAMTTAAVPVQVPAGCVSVKSFDDCMTQLTKPISDANPSRS
jgi:general secretion pathway protein J